MLQWINEKDERNYFNGRFGVDRFNKACKLRREAYPYNKNSYSDVINNIKTRGHHIIKNVFDVSTLLSLKQETDSIIESGNNLKLNNTHWQVIDQPLINCSKIAFDLATDDLLVNIASEFFECTPALGTLNLRRSRVNSSPEDTTNLFHVDPNSIKFLKFFLYLNDVKEIEDGPLTLIEGSHNRKFIGWQNKYRWTKDEMTTIYGEEKIKYMLANVGDLIIATTTAFHRGTKVKSKDRTMYTINYVVHPEEFKKPVFEAKKEHIDALSEDKKPIVDFLLKV